MAAYVSANGNWRNHMILISFDMQVQKDMAKLCNIRRLSIQFRRAIEKARDVGEFERDICFFQFPQGCCGDASDLLNEFLMNNGMSLWYVCGTHYYHGKSTEEAFYKMQSHAWLTTEDPRKNQRYAIIDITGDQFKKQKDYLNYDIPVYVGEMDDFHRLFRVEPFDIRPCCRLAELGALCRTRLVTLYQIITSYIDSNE